MKETFGVSVTPHLLATSVVGLVLQCGLYHAGEGGPWPAVGGLS